MCSVVALFELFSFCFLFFIISSWRKLGALPLQKIGKIWAPLSNEWQNLYLKASTSVIFLNGPLYNEIIFFFFKYCLIPSNHDQSFNQNNSLCKILYIAKERKRTYLPIDDISISIWYN